MNKISTAVLLLAAGASAALAASYDDFSRGLNANSRGDSEAAISAFTAALAAGDLVPNYVPTAYLGRARAYLRKGKCAEALADLDAMAKLKANGIESYLLRVAAESCLNKLEAALADFNSAVELRPSAGLYESFARFEWNNGRFPQAAEHYTQAIKLADNKNRHKPYLVLWYAISAGRAGTLDRAKLADIVHELDTDDWPAPVLDFFLDEMTAEKVYRSAASRDSRIAQEQKCEADFYLGEWWLARGDVAAAKPLMQTAAENCPENFIEKNAAKVELKRLP